MCHSLPVRRAFEQETAGLNTSCFLANCCMILFSYYFFIDHINLLQYKFTVTIVWTIASSIMSYIL
jgi:hypothetical protein